jgi:hypothetical protein
MKHGIVTSKRVLDDGHVKIIVQGDRAGVTYDNVVVGNSNPGDVKNIEEGWHVAIEQCDDGLWICVSVLNTNPDHTPADLQGRERSIQFDDGTSIKALQNDDGSYNVEIESSGDVKIHSGGSFQLVDKAGYGIVSDENGNFTWYNKSVDFVDTTTANINE